MASSSEGVLAEIENPFNQAVEAICATMSEEVMRTHQVPLAHFVIYQLLRTTSFRQQLRDMAALLGAAFERRGGRAPFDPDENDHALFHTLHA